MEKNKIKILYYVIIPMFFLLLSGCFGGDRNNNTPGDKIPANQNDNNNTGNDNVDPVTRASNLVNHGTDYNKEDEYSKLALEILNETENSFFVLYYKGYAFEIVGNYDKAIGNYEDALAQEGISKKNESLVINQIGHVYDLMGDKEKANEYYLKAEALGEVLVGNLINRGRYEYRKTNYDDAEKYFNQALGLESDSFVKAEIYFNLATIYQNKEDGLEQSITYAEKGIEEEKDYPYNYLALGISYIFIGGDELDKSEKMFMKVLSLAPMSSQGQKYLGVYYYIKDDFDRALMAFEKQLEFSSKDVLLMADQKEISRKDAIYDLSRVYALKGNTEKTIEYLNQILQGEDNNLFLSFFRDLGEEDTPFMKVKDDEKFKQNLANIVEMYSK